MMPNERVGSPETASPRVRAWLALLALLFALTVSAAVQWELRWPAFEAWMPLAWGAAALVGAVAWRFSGGAAPGLVTAPSSPAPSASVAGGRAAIATAGLLVAIALVLLLRDLRSPTGTILWALSLAAIPLALAWHEGRLRRFSLRWTKTRAAWTLATLVLVAGSLALRLHQIETIPAKFLDDEGSVADWGLNYLEGRPFYGQHAPKPQPLFRNGFPAQPLLGSVLHVLPVYFTGTTITGARLMPALAGALTVGVLFLLLRRQVRPWAAFAAAFLLAVCHTHLYWSRSGNLQSLTTFTLSASIAFVLGGLRSGSLAATAAAGVLLGLAQYFYEGARFFVPIFALFLTGQVIAERSLSRQRLTQILVMAVAAAVTFAPIGFWYVANPDEFLGRSRGVWIFAQPNYVESRYPGLDTAGVILAQLRRALEGFAFRGDGSNFYALRGPILDPVMRTLVLTGLGSLFVLRPPFRSLACLWLWVPILIVCIPTVDPPSMTRLATALPALFVIAAVVLDRLGGLAWVAGGRVASGFLLAGVIAALAYAATWNTSEFFDRYPREHLADAQTLGGLVARQAGPDFKILSLGNPFSAWSASVRYPARDSAAENLDRDALPIPERGWRNGLLFLRGDDTETLERARSLYPRAEVEEHVDGRGAPFLRTLRVTADDLNRAAPPLAAWKVADAQFGHIGTGVGELSGARALAIDARGFVYVADPGSRQIEVFDADGRPAFRFGRDDATPDAVGLVSALAFLEDGSLLALSTEPPRLRRFAPDGTRIGDIEPGESLIAPTAIAAAPGGFYVTDAGSARVLHLGLDGRVLASAGGPGGQAGEFDRPVAIAATPGGRVFVFDQGNDRIQHFTPDLVYGGEWPHEMRDTRIGQILAASRADPDHLYVVNPPLGVVERYRLDGTPSWPVGQRGDFTGQLTWPVAVAVDARGNVFVLDETRGPVLRYDLSRNLALTRPE
jgi:hypothetical protein